MISSLPPAQSSSPQRRGNRRQTGCGNRSFGATLAADLRAGFYAEIADDASARSATQIPVRNFDDLTSVPTRRPFNEIGQARAAWARTNHKVRRGDVVS